MTNTLFKIFVVLFHLCYGSNASPSTFIVSQPNGTKLEINIRDKLGVKQQLLNPKEIHDLEPNIKPIYDGGVFYSYAKHTNNPRRLLLKLFDLFSQKGGKFFKYQIPSRA